MSDDGRRLLVDVPTEVLARLVDAICALQDGDRAMCERLIDEAILLQAFFDESDEVAYQA